MSLDFELVATRPTVVFERNITHNLANMASAAGLYEPLWQPTESGYHTAQQLIPRLQAGLNNLIANPDAFKRLEPYNGWGTYDDLVTFTRDALAACESNPDAELRVSR